MKLYHYKCLLTKGEIKIKFCVRSWNGKFVETEEFSSLEDALDFFKMKIKDGKCASMYNFVS